MEQTEQITHLDDAISNPRASPMSHALMESTVSTIASNYMLMEYAAQLKGLTQHRIVRGVKRLKHVPREVCDVARVVKSEALKLLAIIRSEIEELASGRKAQKAKMEQIKNSHSFLQAATELLDQAEVETVQRAKKRRQSALAGQQPATILEEASPTAPSTDLTNAPSAVSSLAALMSGLSNAGSASTPTPPPAPTPSPTSSAADAAKINELASLVAALSQQMAALKGVAPPTTNATPVVAPGGAVASVGPTVPVAPAMTSSSFVAPTVNVPQAPPLAESDFWFTGSVQRSPVPVAPVMSKAATSSSVPMAPPAPAAPIAPVLSDITPSSTNSGNARSALLGDITNRQVTLRPTASNKRKSGVRSQSVIDTTSNATTNPILAAAVAKKTSAVQCYTRRIPGSESMSLTDSIKVASKIKLRKTEQDRSPGGTPCKSHRPYSASSTQDVLQAALQARFKNLNALEGAAARQTQQRSMSVMIGGTSKDAGVIKSPPPKFQPIPSQAALAAHHNRRSSMDKENWETA